MWKRLKSFFFKPKRQIEISILTKDEFDEKSKQEPEISNLPKDKLGRKSRSAPEILSFPINGLDAKDKTSEPEILSLPINRLSRKSRSAPEILSLSLNGLDVQAKTLKHEILSPQIANAMGSSKEVMNQINNFSGTMLLKRCGAVSLDSTCKRRHSSFRWFRRGLLSQCEVSSDVNSAGVDEEQIKASMERGLMSKKLNVQIKQLNESTKIT